MKRIGYVQFEPILGDVPANRNRIAAALDGLGADLVVLPELSFTGYCMENREQAHSLAEDPTDSESVDLLTDLCRVGGYYVVAGFAERSGDAVYNGAVMVGPEGLAATYRKIHLFGFEGDLFDPGPDPPAVYDIGGLKVGMMICFDWFFPETARLLALAGADVIAHPANLVLDWCQKAMVTRCLENNLFAVTANRYGREVWRGKDLRFTGGSQITAPLGVVMASAPVEGDETRIVEIDPEKARNKKLNIANDLLGDRRTELYGKLLPDETD